MSIYFINFIFFDYENKKPVIVLKKTQNTVSMIGFSLKKILTLKFNRICFSKVLFIMHFEHETYLSSLFVIWTLSPPYWLLAQDGKSFSRTTT